MALTAAPYISPSPAKLSRSCIFFAPRFSHPRLGSHIRVRCVSSSVDPSKSTAVAEKPLISTKSGNWRWRFQGTTVNINYEEHQEENCANEKNILMIPTISDVSTVEEWKVVAQDIVARKGNVNWRATIVDWPGLGDSERPLLNYNVDVMENFLIQLINAADSPLRNTGGRVLSERRSRLKPDILEALICLKDWDDAANHRQDTIDDIVDDFNNLDTADGGID